MNVREDDDTETDRPAGNSRALTLAVCSAAIGGTFQYGYNLSIINAPTNHIQRFINDTYWERWGTGLDTSQVTLLWTVIVSAFSLGGLTGALLAGPMAVRCGRKNSLLLNNSFLFLGAVLALTSRAARSVEMIIFARLLVGVNAGVSMNVQPMYFVESAPKHLRGAVAFSSAVFTAFGIFLGQVVGLTELLGTEPLWPYLLASNALPGLLQLLTLPWFPESPRYLLMDRGNKEACARALGRFRGGADFSLEMEEMLQEQADAGGATAKIQTPWDLFSNRSLHPQLRTVMAASSAMMLCGNDSIYFYASYIFLAAGIPVEKVQYVSIGTGACEFTAAVVCNLLIERVGRRMLLSGGYALMAVWALVFTLALTLQGYSVPGMPYLSMACVFCYILSFGMGPAGVTGILPAEIFDQTARPAAYMVAGSLMWINLLIVGMAFPFLVSYLNALCFIPFCCVCVAASLFVGLTLPETKGRTLAEITAEFDRSLLKKGPEKQGPEPMKEQYQLDDRVIALQEVTIPKGMEATTVKQIITHLFGLNSANVTQTFKIRNHKGCLIPFNSFIPVNSKHMPYVLEVATVFQHVIPKPRTIAMTVINKSMRTRLQGVVRRIVRLEELFPQIKLRRHEKIYQEIELLNQQLRFLHKRMQMADSHSWMGMFIRTPMW
ncbi:solute carrier family 2, facilitated glucose transporter member 11-like [Oncorhynchus clarkii lewisi]|uniref:solute carrier family 2, facilitated glucose transporter member 11-like n=1 Tax=Oncorhynchus clarkii lewisi TaxID=490388 RepID=UPI0039B8E07B